MAIDTDSLNTLTAEQIKQKYLEELNKPAEETTIYRRTLPNGRIVEAESLELLTDKLVDIAAKGPEPKQPTEEVQAQAQQTEAEQQAARQSDLDSEFVLAQKFMSNPSQALAETLGFASITEAKAALQEAASAKAAQAANAQAELYVAHHPPTTDGTDDGGFFPCEHNGKAIQSYMRMNNISCTEAGIHQAVTALRKEGLLRTKPADSPEDVEKKAYAMKLEDLRIAAGGLPKNDVENKGWDF